LQSKKTLIYTALTSEAQAIVEYLKLTKIDVHLYENEDVLLLVGGIGKQRTIFSLKSILSKYSFTKAINIGIAGCNNKEYNIGELISATSHSFEDIRILPIITVNLPQANYDILSQHSQTYLYDMEAEYFLQVVSKYIDKDNIYIFKVISDHLDTKKPTKEFVKNLIKNRLNFIIKNDII